jgi:hypothetical protein
LSHEVAFCNFILAYWLALAQLDLTFGMPQSRNHETFTHSIEYALKSGLALAQATRKGKPA